MAVDLVVEDSEGADSRPSALALKAEGVVALSDADVTHLSPVLTPGVADDPVLTLGVISAPADNRNDVVNFCVGVLGDATFVVKNGLGRDAAGDGAASVDLLGHVISARDGAVLGHRGVGEGGDADALAAGRAEGRAGTGDVLVSATPVGVRAETLSALRRAGKVGVGGLVRDASSGALGLGVDPLVRADDGTTVAAADTAAVEDVLDRQVDVDAGGVAGNLDAVSESGNTAVGPA